MSPLLSRSTALVPLNLRVDAYELLEMCWITLSGPNAPRVYTSDDDEKLILNTRYVDIAPGVDIDRYPEKYVSTYHRHMHRHPHFPHHHGDHNSCDEPTYRIAVPEPRWHKDRRPRGRYVDEYLRGRGRRRERSPTPPPVVDRRPLKKRVRFADDVDDRIVDPPDAEFRIQGEKEGSIEVGGIGIGGRVKGEVRGDVRFEERRPRRMRRVKGRENLGAGFGRRRERREYPPFGSLKGW